MLFFLNNFSTTKKQGMITKNPSKLPNKKGRRRNEILISGKGTQCFGTYSNYTLNQIPVKYSIGKEDDDVFD
jgi:hypothetical protein